jgi:hypothetical protein
LGKVNAKLTQNPYKIGPVGIFQTITTNPGPINQTGQTMPGQCMGRQCQTNPQTRPTNQPGPNRPANGPQMGQQTKPGPINPGAIDPPNGANNQPANGPTNPRPNAQTIGQQPAKRPDKPRPNVRQSTRQTMGRKKP